MAVSLGTRKRRRIDAGLEDDSCHNNNNNRENRTLRKTKSLSEISSGQIQASGPDLTISTNSVFKVDTPPQEVNTETIGEGNIDNDVFNDSDNQTVADDIKSSDGAEGLDDVDVTEKSDNDPVLSASRESFDGTDYPAESNIETSTQQVLASCESDVGSDIPAGAIIETNFQQMPAQVELMEEKTSSQPNVIEIATPEHETQPDTVDVSTQEVLNDANTSSHEAHDASINRTMDQYTEMVLDDCSNCKELEKSVSHLLKELHDKNDAFIELLEEEQLLLKQTEDLKLQNEKLESVVMDTAARMRHSMEKNEEKDQVIGRLEEKIQELYERYDKENKLLQIQVKNHNEKEKMMSENLNHYMDENIKLKNEKKVLRTNSSDSTDGQTVHELSKLYKESTRFKQYVNNNFVMKTGRRKGRREIIDTS